MRWIRRLRARIKYRDFDADLRCELDVHRAMVEDDLAARGVLGDDVRRQASRALGNLTLERERARRVWIASWLESVWQDVRYAMRRLRRSPIFVVTTLVIQSRFSALSRSHAGPRSSPRRFQSSARWAWTRP